MKSEREIDELMKIAVAADLEGLSFVAQFDYEQLSAYNGIGPQSLSEDKRKKLSKYLALFAPAALIHDMRYEVGDGTRKGFNYANMEFRENCIKLAKYKYGFLNWRRYCAWLAAQAMFGFVSGPDGWEAWIRSGIKSTGISACTTKEQA